MYWFRSSLCARSRRTSKQHLFKEGLPYIGLCGKTFEIVETFIASGGKFKGHLDNV